MRLLPRPFDVSFSSGTDDAWRRIGTPENLTTITGVLWLDGAIGYDELCDRLEERLCRFDRFRQRVGGRLDGTFLCFLFVLDLLKPLGFLAKK